MANTTLGVATIGQGPREDIRGLFAAEVPRGTRVILRGCLDGLSEAEVSACTPTRSPIARAELPSPRPSFTSIDAPLSAAMR